MHRRFADDDGTSIEQPLRYRCILVWHMVGKERRTGCGSYTGRCDVVLDCDGHAVQQTEPARIPCRFVGGFGLADCVFLRYRNHRVDVSVMFFDCS